LLSAALGIAVPAASGAESEATSSSEALAVQIPDDRNTVGIVAGPPGSASLAVVSQLSSVVDRNTLRIVPIAGSGPIQNISDLLHLKGTDAAIVQTDALEAAARSETLESLNEKISYLATMQKAVVHLIASGDIKDLKSLSGKRINVGAAGSGAAITANAVLGAAGINFAPTSFDDATALQNLKTGRIDAMVYIDFAPAPLLQRMDSADGLKLIALPMPARMAANPQLARHYQPAWLRHGDYNGLVERGTSTETVSVGTALVGYNWPAKSKGHDRLARLYAALAGNLETLAAAPYHPSWRSVTLSARLDGWERHRASRQQNILTDRQNKQQQDDELHALRALFKMQLGAQQAQGGGNQSEASGAVLATE
jgi:TRAP-type uncharacterized transport system substrate-binding protein